MPEYLAPGVFVEEAPVLARSIAATDHPVTVFVGCTALGPVGSVSPVIASFAAFKRHYGGLGDLRTGGGRRLVNHVAHAARCFFAEGGRRLRIVRVSGGDGRAPSLRGYRSALRKAHGIAGLTTVAAPGSAAIPAVAAGVRQALLDHAARLGSRCFVLLDPDVAISPVDAARLAAGLNARAAALYYPWIEVANPNTRSALMVPPSGPLAGIVARVDRARGLHRAPANEVIQTALGLERVLSAAESDRLNPAGVNALRQFPARGIRVWGARTLSSDPEWKYLNVQRYLGYLEQSVREGLDWAVFEPNDESLWAATRQAVDAFLYKEWRAGCLVGSRPGQAFFVRCDRSTMTRADIRQKRLVILVGCAPVKPAEFVVLRVTRRTA